MDLLRLYMWPNHAGLVVELASPIFPSLFLTLACLGSIARAITGGATTCFLFAFALAVAAWV